MSETGAGGAGGGALDPEEQARANLYGLIGRLFYAPLDPNLLSEISRSGEEGGSKEPNGGLGAAWRAVREACRSAFPAVARQEYETLFVGVGKAEVTPYLSGYAEPSGPDRYLVRLREQLAEWRLTRRNNVFEVEDHISGACDVMRWLIAEGRSMAEQKRFFEAFVLPGSLPFLAAVQNAASANFYKPVALFAVTFLEIERAAFEMAEVQ